MMKFITNFNLYTMTVLMFSILKCDTKFVDIFISVPVVLSVK